MTVNAWLEGNKALFLQKHKYQNVMEPVFTSYQIEMLNLVSQVRDDRTMQEINQMLSDYFARKAQTEIDRLWDCGELNDRLMEDWKGEHMRTPYK